MPSIIEIDSSSSSSSLPSLYQNPNYIDLTATAYPSTGPQTPSSSNSSSSSSSCLQYRLPGAPGGGRVSLPEIPAEIEVLFPSCESAEPKTNPAGAFTFDEFCSLWKNAENRMGESTEHMEHRKEVRHANNNLPGLPNQLRAQYGRITFSAMKKLFELTRLLPEEIFLDIGHGIGNAPLQAGLTIGCESRGIEVVSERCDISKRFQDAVFEQSEQFPSRNIGSVELRNGDLTDSHQLPFMTDVDVVLYNNANDIGTSRSAIKGKYSLDDYAGGIFALLKPGARMITLTPMYHLGRSLVEENAFRTKHGLNYSIDASFFNYEEHRLPLNSTTWCPDREISAYIYTRCFQSDPEGSAFFLCSDKECYAANIPTAAIQRGKRLIQENCVSCTKKRLTQIRIRN